MPTIGDNTGDDYAGAEDAHGRSSETSTNYNTTTEYVSSYTGDLQHTWLKFSGISSLSSTVTAATLYLYITEAGCATFDVDLNRCLRNWVENQVCWANWSTGNAWTTAGGTSTGNDISATVTADWSMSSTTGAYDSISTAQLATDVDDFRDGTYSNYGWLLYPDSGQAADCYRRFISSDGTDGQRPYLSVTVSGGGGLSIPIAAHHYQHNSGSSL